MDRLKDSEIKSIGDGKQKRESLGRNNGALIFRREGKTVTAYYRYWRGKKSVFIKLDNYKMTPKSAGKTSAQLRDQALDMVVLRKEVAPLDLKEYLQDQQAEQLKQQEAKRIMQQSEARKGSFHDLMEFYAETLKKRHEKRGTKQSFDVMANFRTHVIKPFPDLANKKAEEVQPMDLSPVFTTIMKRNAPGTYNKIRQYLSACFNYGIRADYTPRETLKNNKLFNIKLNPVKPFPIEQSNPRARELSHQEIRTLWRDIDLEIFVDMEQYGLFVKFCFACFGNRPEQLMRVKWSDIDFEDNTLTFLDYKGKGSPRTTIIPLTDSALTILRRVRELEVLLCLTKNGRPVRDNDLHVFKTSQGTMLSYGVLERKVREHNNSIQMMNIRDSEIRGVEYKPVERWTLRDFRRTATSIMTRARIIKEHRYLLQSRTDGSIESRHYDVSDRMDEKREAAERYETVLNQILENDKAYSNKAPIDSYEGFREMVLENSELRDIKDYVREGYRKKDVQQWVRQMMAADEVEKYGRLYVLKGFKHQNEKRLMEKRKKTKEYKAFKKEILNSDSYKLPTQWDYAKNKSVSRKMVGHWYRIMRDEGIVEKIGRHHYLKNHAQSNKRFQESLPEFKSSNTNTVDNYSDFKKNIVSIRTIKTQRDYMRDGYSERQIRAWFKQLQAEKLIKKEGQRYILTDHA